MAIGNKNKTYENKNVYFVNIVTKETGEDGKEKEVKPYFSFKKKTGEKTYSEVAKDTSFSGSLTKVLIGEREYQGIKQPRVKTIFEDGDDVYILDQGFTILSRSYFNSLLSLNSIDGINVNIYQTKPNEKGKVFPQISVWQGETMVRWKYEKADLPEVKKVKVKGVEMSDTEDVDNFIKAKLAEKFVNTPTSSGKPTASTPDGNDVDSEEVPF